MTSSQTRDLCASVGVPFLAQAILVAVAYPAGATNNLWLVSGLFPVLAGFVFLVRGLRLYAAPLALVFFPLMFGLMFFFTFLVLGVLYDASL